MIVQTNIREILGKEIERKRSTSIRDKEHTLAILRLAYDALDTVK
tara:strand:- start:253 stop:387 length:135 start_codon:yes stop_codon:yes gene_type:complete